MKKDRPKTRETLAANVRFLRGYFQLSQTELAKKSGVSQKTVSNIEAVAGDTDDVKLENVEKIASAFGLSGWQLIVPALPQELLVSGRLQRLVDRYTAISEEGRDHIDLVAERESSYGKNK